MGLTRSGKLRGAPTGTPEDAKSQGGVKQQSIRRQNEAADALAFAQFRVEHSPTIEPLDGLKASKDPDFRIEGRIFDCYSPVARHPRNPIIDFAAMGPAEKKTVGKQAHRLLALYSLARIEQRERGTFDEFDDSISDTSGYPKYAAALKDFLLAKMHVEIREKVKSGQTRNIVLNLADSICSPSDVRDFITQIPIGGLECVLAMKPKPGAKPVQSFQTGDDSYGVFEPGDMMIEEFEFAPPATPGVPSGSSATGTPASGAAAGPPSAASSASPAPSGGAGSSGGNAPQ